MKKLALALLLSASFLYAGYSGGGGGGGSVDLSNYVQNPSTAAIVSPYGVQTASVVFINDHTIINSTTVIYSNVTNEYYMKLISWGDIFASSETMAGNPDLVDIVMDSITITGAFFFSYRPSVTSASEFNIALSTVNDVAEKPFTYLFDKSQTLGVNQSSTTIVSISTPVASGTWISVHVTSCATSGTLPAGFGGGIKYKRN